MTLGFETILPFLRPIEHLIRDDSVSEIMVNGSTRVFIERAGVLEQVSDLALSEKSLMVAVKNIARRLGDDISEAKPILDSRLPDGSRVAAVIPPCSIHGVILTIRKFNSRHFSIEDLVRMGTLESGHSVRLQGYVQNRQNILISGGTGSGKTTLLNALGKFISDEDRILLIEDTSEIQLEKPNLVRFEARQAQADLPAITIRDLLRASLRHRPDRIILGEIRGGEAFDLLQLLNTGHSGTLSTVHASSAAQALARFTSCVLQSGIELPYRAIKSNIADSLNVLIQLERRPGKRFVSEMIEIRGYNSETDHYAFLRFTQHNPNRAFSGHSMPDSLSASEYILDNFKSSDRIAVLLRNRSTGEVIQRIASADKIAARDFQQWLTDRNEAGFDIYIGMNTLKDGAYSRTKRDIHEIRHVYLDLDYRGPEALKAIQKSDEVPKPNFVLDTSPGKHQVVWKIEGATPHEAVDLQQRMAHEFAADLAATDASRVLRLPGFANRKYDAECLVRATKNSDKTYNLRDFKVASAPAKGDLHPEQSPPRLGGRKETITQSERDWAYAKRALARGDDPEEVIRRIADFRADEKDSPEYYARHTVAKAQAELQGRAATQSSEVAEISHNSDFR